MPIIAVEHLSYAYPAYVSGVAAPKVLDDISLSVEKGEALAILGPTGAGKSTLCLALNGIIPHLSGGDMLGRVLVAGTDTRDTSPAELAGTISTIYQDPDSQLFCPTVEEEVAYGLENLGLDPREITERVEWALRTVRLGDCRHSSPTRLSGGQKQRAAIACSLAMLPEILILDEPASSLDPSGQAEVFAAIESLRSERRMTLVMVDTDPERLVRYANRLALLVAGRIIALDDPGKLLADKKLLETAGINPPQMMELAWSLNPGWHSAYAWLAVEQAEHDLRSRLQGQA